MDLIVVDGPNLFNTVGQRLQADGSKEQLVTYLCKWFDLDRLILATVEASENPDLGIVIFHSRRPLGAASYRLEQQMQDSFWGRQGASPNTSCIVVDIPGEQHENYEFECKQCHAQNTATTKSEKGVDTTITTYLLETAPRWDSVCIFSRDVDFVPPVLSLRRLGKKVFCAVEDVASASALVRACQSAFALDIDFLHHDFALNRFFTPGGDLDQIVGALVGESVTFVVEPLSEAHRAFMRTSRRLDVVIGHAGGAPEEARLRGLVEGQLASLRADSPILAWERRNDTILILYLQGPDLLFEGLSRHADLLDGATWPKHLGTIGDILTSQESTRVRKSSP